MLLQNLIHIISDTSNESIQEEFLLPDGTYELKYLKYILEDKKITNASFNAALIEAGLPFSIEPIKNVKNEVSELEFHEEYEFGKFVNVRQWINVFNWKHRKVLTREALFHYVIPEYYVKLAYGIKIENAQKKVS